MRNRDWDFEAPDAGIGQCNQNSIGQGLFAGVRVDQVVSGEKGSFLLIVSLWVIAGLEQLGVGTHRPWQPPCQERGAVKRGREKRARDGAEED